MVDMPSRLTVLGLLLCAGCERAPQLTVRVQSDLAAGLELRHVTATVHEGTAGCPPSGLALVGGGSEDVAEADAAQLAAGSFTVADVSVRQAVYTVHVGANVSGRTVDRCVVVAVTGDRVVRVPIVASCQGVVCPAPGGSTDYTECLNGRCVDPRCDPDDPATHERCCDRALLGSVCDDDETLCESAGDCTTSATCRADARCDEGVCLDGPDTCPDDAYCSSETRACMPLGTPTPDAGTRDAGAVDAGSFDAGPPPDAPPCSGTLDCTACPGGYCLRETCQATNPTTLSYDFEFGVPAGWDPHTWECIGAGWLPDTSTAHGGSTSLVGVADTSCRDARARFDLTLASEASLTFWLRTMFGSPVERFELLVDAGTVLQRDTSTDWVQYEVALAPGRHTLELLYSGTTGGAWIDDLVIGPPIDPSTGFEDSALPLAYQTTAAPFDRSTERWRTDETMPHGGTRAARSGFLGTGFQTSSLTRSVVLTADRTLSFWVRTSSATRHRLLVYVDGGAPRDSWSGETPWTFVSYPLAAGPHTIEWRYEKDTTAAAGADAVWIDDVAFDPRPSTGGPLCGS